MNRSTILSIPVSSIGGLKSNKQSKQLTTHLSVLPPLSLYIHWPWCVRKCPYCDFNSHEYESDIHSNTINEQIESQYIQALLHDLEYELPHIWGRRIYSIFIGGGTPSLMRPHALDQLLAGIRARVLLDPNAEITLEANPGTVESTRLKNFAHAGINRLSIGVQSFNSQHLQAIGRIHNSWQAIDAVKAAVKAVSNVNIDLMYGLPKQSLVQANEDIDQALQLGVNHLSAYHLTLEPNTYFSRYPPSLPDEDLCADMHSAIDTQLNTAGFIQYETSAYAKHNHICQHNQNYWTFGDYIGIGAGAHGKISFPNQIIRTVKHKHPKTYLNTHIINQTNDIQMQTTDIQLHHDFHQLLQVLHNPFLQSQQILESKALPFEFMLNALRLQQGFNLTLFTERTGQSIINIQSILDSLQKKGLLDIYPDLNRQLNHVSNEQTWVRPTAFGQHFLNDIIESFL